MSADKARATARRAFLKQAGLGAAGSLLVGGAAAGEGTVRRGVALLVEGGAVTSSAPARWAVAQLQEALRARQVDFRTVARLGEAEARALCLVAGGPGSEAVRSLRVPEGPEAFALAPGRLGGRGGVIFAGAGDARGLVYALLELADVVRLSEDPVAALAALPAQ